LLPNLYYRAGRDTIFGPDVLEQGSAERERMRAVRTKMMIPPIMEDVAALLAFADGQRDAKPGPAGAHGNCLSRPYALATAARYPDRIAAAASFYGTWLVSDAEESPHLSLSKVKGELYIACAEHDDLAPLTMVEELRACSDAPRQRARSSSIPASITASRFRSAGVTTSRLGSATGSG
jgi:carboxymethylenebutenolidase